jgi:hypothetical protein
MDRIDDLTYEYLKKWDEREWFVWDLNKILSYIKKIIIIWCNIL